MCWPIGPLGDELVVAELLLALVYLIPAIPRSCKFSELTISHGMARLAFSCSWQLWIPNTRKGVRTRAMELKMPITNGLDYKGP